MLATHLCGGAGRTTSVLLVSELADILGQLSGQPLMKLIKHLCLSADRCMLPGHKCASSVAQFPMSPILFRQSFDPMDLESRISFLPLLEFSYVEIEQSYLFLTLFCSSVLDFHDPCCNISMAEI